MQEPAKTHVRLWAGEFEVDLRAGEVRRDGEKIRLQQRPFQILAALLERPGEVVTREALQRRLWPTDTFVDFEHSINTAVNKLREALGDDAETPRYIETLPRYGYRFIAPVAEVVEAKARRADAGLRVVPPQEIPVRESPRQKRWIVGAMMGAAAAPPKRTAPRLGGRVHRASVWTAVVVAALSAGGYWYLSHPLPPPRITAYTQITHDGHKKNLAGTDGNRIYLSLGEHFGLPPEIGQVAVSGGVVGPIPVELPDDYQVLRLADASPDGSALLMVSVTKKDSAGPQLWNVRTLGGSVRRMPDTWGGAFSPDGSSVLYTALNGEIWLVRSDGTGAHKLASPGWAADLAWSPDGTVIRFFRDNRLWEMSSSGSNLHQLIPNWHTSSPKCCGRWTPDGRFFLFQSGESAYMDVNSEGGDIWALDERRALFRRPSAEPVQVTTGPTRWGPPIPGEDGKTIFSLGTTPRGELSRYDAQTRQFLPCLGGISAQGVTFSKDGRFVAYVSYPEKVLWRANRDGTNPVQLTDPPMKVYLPRFSPDGTQILFSEVSLPGHVQSYLVPTEGGRPQRLLPDDPGQQGDPSWSPDGRKVVFDIGDINPSHEIRILDLDSRQVITVPGSSGLYSARWSPDGRYIAALVNGQENLTIFDFETQRWSAPFHMSGGLGGPQWSSDSQWVYFQARSGEDSLGIYRIRVGGGKAECIAGLKARNMTGWFGFWFGLDPTDAPLVLRDVGSNDIYALTLEEK